MQIIKAAPGGITGHFGDRNVPGANVPSHLGMDVGHGDMSAAARRVVAPARGRVIATGRSGSYGERVVIDHGNGYSSLLAHLERIDVQVGDELEAGDDVGLMGSTGGNWPVHLHQELRRDGTPIDPEPHLVTLAELTTTTTEEEEEDDMESFIITTGPSAAKYVYSPARKRKRSISKLEWSIMRKGQTAGVPLHVVTVTADELAAIPGK